ncbi:MAG TPA: cupin domain-containing protein [Agromyces sp.]
MPTIRPRPIRRSAIAATVVAATMLLAACSASPVSEAEGARATATEAPSAPATDAPVVVEELGAGESAASVDVEVDGPATVTYRRITLHPGAGTGLHCHYGQLIAVVEAGEFTHRAPTYPSGVHVYEAGDTIIEGAGYVHEGVNESDDDVVLLVTYVTAEGEPLAETDLANCDPVAP